MGGRSALFSAVVACVLVATAAQPAYALEEGVRRPRAPRPVAVAVPVDRVRVPVLMYHHISEVPRDADALRRDLTVTPAAFRAQLAWLQAHGYTTVTADDIWSALFRGTPLPAHPVALTFDDGYADAYDVALPILREFDAVGIFFVVVRLLDREGYLTRTQVRALADAGQDVESHGMDHVNVARLDPVQQRAQLCGSRAILTILTGRPVRHFAYPNGDAPSSFEQVEGCDYASAFLKSGGSEQRRAAPYALQRVRVAGGSGAAALPYLLSR